MTNLQFATATMFACIVVTWATKEIMYFTFGLGLAIGMLWGRTD